MEKDEKPAAAPQRVGAREAAFYTRRILSVYDLGVLGFSNTAIWRCPSRHILDLHNKHASARHLDVGVGTGYFLDRCSFPIDRPAITLLDLNADSLAVAARRLARYAPATCHADVLEPIPLPPQQFGSIGLNYVLHCLPGPFPNKARAFAHLVPLLAPGGVVFGSTILARGVNTGFLARRLMAFYNQQGMFNNAEDSLDDLEAALKAHFPSVAVRVIGCVALFVGRV